MRIGGLAFAAVMLAGPAVAGPRAMSLDQCSDQFVIALADRQDIAAVFPHADDHDSYLREQARGLPQRRPTMESVLAADPDVVVRYWGGDMRLAQMLERRGTKVVKIEESTGFDDVRANVRRVAAALEQPERGEALIARMDAQLARSRGAWGGASALYLTPSGFTAGEGTLIDAVLRAAGLTNAAPRPGWTGISLERLVLDPPRGLVMSFFDSLTNALNRWGAGSHRVLHRLVDERAVGELPGTIAGCPGWFAADGAEILAMRAPP